MIFVGCCTQQPSACVRMLCNPRLPSHQAKAGSIYMKNMDTDVGILHAHQEHGQRMSVSMRAPACMCQASYSPQQRPAYAANRSKDLARGCIMCFCAG